MPEYTFALYNAFSDSSFGGSKAGIIADAQDLDAEQMLGIAREIGAPATCFITSTNETGVDVRFFSTLTEYVMCGHGTIALMTWLLERGIYRKERELSIDLRTTSGTASVDIKCEDDRLPEVMLSLEPASFEPCSVTANELAPLFEIDASDFDPTLPIEISRSDFTHLVLPMRNLQAMQNMKPDYAAITKVCHKLQADTVALFTRETVLPQNTIHCREFCPAVGTPEAPASGTTNRALGCYLSRHGLIKASPDGLRVINAEQGYEMGRPSHIRTELSLQNGQVVGIRVGGVATKTMQGTFYLASPL